MKRILLAMAATSLCATAASGADAPLPDNAVSAAALQKDCDNKAASCWAYLAGFNDAMLARNGWAPMACGLVTLDMMRLSFLRQMAALATIKPLDPAHFRASTILIEAMRQDYPCGK